MMFFKERRVSKRLLKCIGTVWIKAVLLFFLTGLYHLGVVEPSYGQWFEPIASFTAGETPIRSYHFYEVRNAIDNKRILCGLPPFFWTNPSLIHGQTPLRAVHMEELRTAIKDVYDLAPARPLSSFTNSTITPGVTPIRLVHLAELRLAVENAACCGDGVCNGPDEDIGSCNTDCRCNYGPWEPGLCEEGECDPHERLQTKVDQDGTEGCDNIIDCAVDFVGCCSYGEWYDVGCGMGGAGCNNIADMWQEQAAGAGCPLKHKCVADHSDCCTYADAPSDLGCGKGDCDEGEMLFAKAASNEGCPVHPDAECIPEEECCGYGAWVIGDGVCEPAGDECCAAGGGCASYEVWMTREATVNDPDNCSDVDDCAMIENKCCEYGDPVPQECGIAGPLTVICEADEMLEITTPDWPSDECPFLENCVSNDDDCCEGYSAYIDKGCGPAGDCAANQVYQVSSPGTYATGCLDRTRCTTDELTCCGVYAEERICGAATGCDPDEERVVRTPTVPDSGCDVYDSGCVENLIECCGGYNIEFRGCGSDGGCYPEYEHLVNAPENDPTDCPEQDMGCSENVANCCGGYTEELKGCGSDVFCAADQKIIIYTPGNDPTECPTYDGACTLDSDTCCGNFVQTFECGSAAGCATDYKVITYTPDLEGTECVAYNGPCTLDSVACCGAYTEELKGCGPGVGCAANQKVIIYTPDLEDTECTPYDSDCIDDELECCGVYGPPEDQDPGCGPIGECNPNEMYQLSHPGKAASGCDDKPSCRPAEGECCDYGVPQKVGCALGGCYAENKMQYKQTSPNGCADILTCVLDEVECHNCTPGVDVVCVIDNGCPGMQACGVDGRPSGACVKDANVCTPGDWRGCTNAVGAASFQICTICGEWDGACSCDYGEEKKSCVTPEGCPGQRKCANDIWEVCQKITSVCTPGSKISCQTPAGFPGTYTCNDCGDGYGAECLCEPDTQAPCDVGACWGLRTCIGGYWGECIQGDPECVP